MLLDYFIQNKIAIQYNSREEGKQVNAFFENDNHKLGGTICGKQGWLSHYKEIKDMGDGCRFETTYHASSLIYVFDGYTIITAAEFFNLVGESNKSIIDGMEYA